MIKQQNNNLTVVIPTYNRSHELVRALESLVAQTDSDFDVIVCDDGSTEDIGAALLPFQVQLRIKLIRIENSGGPARPRNVATQAAASCWISFLDSDDWWKPEKIASLKSFLNDSVDIIYHPLQVERADKAKVSPHKHGSLIGEPLRTHDALRHMLKFGNPLPTSGTTVRRQLLTQEGGFDESRDLASVEDFDLWLRLVAHGAKIQFIPQALGYYWVGVDQISTFNARQYERQRNLFTRQLNLLPLTYRSLARSNFAYLLGSYALDLGLPGAKEHFRGICWQEEPVRWLKSRIKLLRHSKKAH